MRIPREVIRAYAKFFFYKYDYFNITDLLRNKYISYERKERRLSQVLGVGGRLNQCQRVELQRIFGDN